MKEAPYQESAREHGPVKATLAIVLVPILLVGILTLAEPEVVKWVGTGFGIAGFVLTAVSIFTHAEWTRGTFPIALTYIGFTFSLAPAAKALFHIPTLMPF